MSMTLTPMSALVRETATARAGNTGGSDELATAIVKATQRSGEIYGTQTARASLNSASRLATATAMAPVVAELPRYGVDPGQGYVAWMHNPVTIELQGWMQTGTANDYAQITARDFVLAADITWNTKNSLSGCGFYLRSNGDTNDPTQYTVIISRVASGHLAFLAMVDGTISNFREFFPKSEDKSFSWLNDSTNRLAVVVRGAFLDLYTNGELIGQIDTSQPPPASISTPPPFPTPSGGSAQQEEYQGTVDEYYQEGKDLINGQLIEAKKNFANNKPILTEGLLGFIGMSQSGSMVCKFSDAWLFKIER